MFGIAKTIVRNKFIFIGLLAIVGFFFLGGKKEEDTRPHNPWSAAPAQPAQVASNNLDKDSMTEKALNIADRAAKAAGAEEYSPSALREKSIGNLQKSSSALNQANGD
jgi:hypothetical protein